MLDKVIRATLTICGTACLIAGASCKVDWLILVGFLMVLASY